MDKLRVGFVGSFTSCKNFKTVTEVAFNILKDEVEPMLYGRVGKRVDHKDMYKEYNKMDCMVVSSKVNEKRPYETGPVPPLEAALCGRPTVTTRCGQLPYTFDDTQALFYDGTVEGLVNSLKIFINDRKLCKEMGRNAREQMLGPAGWPNIVKTHDRFFERVYERSKI
jgi:glycosyltransferase involved in cell wall biosynthesis